MASFETSIHKHFIKISDPRDKAKTQHSLLNILTIVLCAAIGGSEDFYDIEEFAKCKEEFFRTFPDLPNGMPSHDTINRVISKESLIKQEKKTKGSIKGKRKRAGWNDEYLLKLLGAI